jgi:hypothetical protein
MVAIDMNPMLSKVIKINICLWVRGPSRLSKDLGSKKCLNILKREESKEMKDSFKVEEGGVHCKKYDGQCTKQ